MKNGAVSIVRCDSYESETVRVAFDKLLEPTGALDFIKPGMKIAVKANLVAAVKPERAATTHPALLTELCRRIVALGATPIVGDSPGGPFSGMYLKGVYSATGMNEVKEAHGVLNSNFDVTLCDSFPEAEVLKSFSFTSWLREADAIINFAKLKTHGMMSMSCAVKNMFGAIPGTMKPEYHYRFPNSRDFANMLIDIDEFFRPALNIVDGVVGMEGNGPTMGDTRQIGIIACSPSPYNLDCVLADIVGLSPEKVPTLQLAIERGLGDALSDIEVTGDGAGMKIDDFKNIERANGIEFLPALLGVKSKLAGRFVKAAMSSRPKLIPKTCIGCRKCEGICPAHAITMKNKKPKIDRGACIRCFCCQEFCPKGALVVHRPVAARILTKSGSNKNTKAPRGEK